jgi:hypothetical protein
MIGADEERPGQSRPQLVAAIALVVLYLAMLAVMTVLRHDSDWDRLVYLLTGFEAIAFAGAGALFGATTQRAEAAGARRDAAAARAATDRARHGATEDLREATAGRMLAVSIITKEEVRLAERGGRRGARPAGAEAEPIDDDLAELAELARRAFPTLRT